MNLAYYRKSPLDSPQVLENLRANAAQAGLQILGEVQLPDAAGTLLHICNPAWMGNLIAADPNLVGLLPCSVVVLEKDGAVTVGAGRPAILGSVSQRPDIQDIALEAETAIKQLIDSSAGVGAPTPVQVTLYSTKTCPYCKMEQAWLERNGVKHDVIYVDMDEQAARRMVEATGQMGVPVTEIHYSDADPDYIIGFDRPQLTQLLGVAA